MTEPNDDIAARIRRDMDDIQEQRRRGPLIDFGNLQLGGESRAFGVRFGWPEFLGFLAFWIGVVFGRSQDQFLTGIVYALAVWLPLRLLISGWLWLLGKFNSSAAPGNVKPLPAIIAWPLLGLGGGALAGAALAAVLGGDIPLMEGVMKLAPLGLIAGVVIGVVRRKRT